MNIIKNIVDTQQAFQTLKVNSDSSFEDVKSSYRKLALELHPDKNTIRNDGNEFKQIAAAYHFLKKQYKSGNVRRAKSKWQFTETNTKKRRDSRKKTRWGPPPAGTPEEDWSRFTKDFEESNPNWYKEYERKFWEKYNARITVDGKNGEFEKTKEPKAQPNLFTFVDESLCIGCCSCETIAPEVFSIDKNVKTNPKSSVINQKGAGINKIMNAAETCPTKAINVKNIDTKEKLFPF
jgi:ferredoxin